MYFLKAHTPRCFECITEQGENSGLGGLICCLSKTIMYTCEYKFVLHLLKLSSNDVGIE